MRSQATVHPALTAGLSIANHVISISPDLARQITIYAITGFTGKVGGVVARTLLAAEEPFRVVVRDVESFRFAKESKSRARSADLRLHISLNSFLEERRRKVNAQGQDHCVEDECQQTVKQGYSPDAA